MYRDNEVTFSLAQPVTVSASSTNNVDKITADVTGDDTLYLVIRAVTAVTAAGAATVTFDLQTDSDPAFGTPMTLFSSGAISKSSLTATTWVVRTPLPSGMKQYSRLYYTVATGPLTAGTFDAFITNALDVRR